MAPLEGSTNRICHQSNSLILEVTQAKPSVPDEAATDHNQGRPLIVDIMHMPNFPVVKSFKTAGWNTFAVDWVFTPTNLSESKSETIKEVKQADFI